MPNIDPNDSSTWPDWILNTYNIPQETEKRALKEDFYFISSVTRELEKLSDEVLNNVIQGKKFAAEKVRIGYGSETLSEERKKEIDPLIREIAKTVKINRQIRQDKKRSTRALWISLIFSVILMIIGWIDPLKQKILDLFLHF